MTNALTPGSYLHTKAAAADFWNTRREASLNWLALGLLLAAWNASSNEVSDDSLRRPRGLRYHSYVSPRTAQRIFSFAVPE